MKLAKNIYIQLEDEDGNLWKYTDREGWLDPVLTLQRYTRILEKEGFGK